MSLAAIILLLLSVAVHAGWNAISRHRRPATSFMMLATAVGMVVLSPAAIWHAPHLLLLTPAFWLALAASCLFQAVYYIALSAAYRAGEMSLVYPIARALPALLVPLVSVCVGRAEELRWWLGIGGGLIVLGAMLLPMGQFRGFGSLQFSGRAVFLAVLTAVGTTGYTVLDYYCMRLLQQPSGPLGPLAAPLTYIALQGLGTCLWLGVYILLVRVERAAIGDVLRNSIRPAILTGVGIYVAYALVLAAYTCVTDPSYVAAFRQLSIPIGMAIGLTLLGETRTGPKFVGAAMIFAGVVIASLK